MEGEQQYEGADRRRFERLKTSVHIRGILYEDKDGGVEVWLKQHPGLSHNISAGGVIFRTDRLVPVGSILKLEVDIPTEVDPIEAVARVVRTEEIEGEGAYDIGVCFLNLTPKEQERIIGLCVRS